MNFQRQHMSYNYNYMIYSQEDKRLVDEYKQTNIRLRKQLNNLNSEIDRILLKKASKVGQHKLPSVTKQITDPNIMQQQIDNMKKRVEVLERDAELFRNKSSVNYYGQIKELEGSIQAKEEQMQQIRKIIKTYERKDKIAQTLQQKDEKKIDKRIAHIQQEIHRYQKIQKQLLKEISYQQANQHKNSNYMQQLLSKRKDASIKKQQKEKRINYEEHLFQQQQLIKQQAKQSQDHAITEEQWKQLKKDFLMFKQQKYNEENSLNQQNQRLRTEIKQWEKKIKQKQKLTQSPYDMQSKGKRSRIYSTLVHPQQSDSNQVYRYRDRNNSIQYHTKQ